MCHEGPGLADPADDWYRQQPDDGPQELTYVDDDTRLVRILIAPASPGGRLQTVRGAWQDLPPTRGA